MVKLSDLVNLSKNGPGSLHYCNIIAISNHEDETGVKTVRIIEKDGLHFWHEMKNGNVVNCFEVLLHWKPFPGVMVYAFTPDGLHIYEFETRLENGERVANICPVTSKRLESVSFGMGVSCKGISVFLVDKDHISINGKKVEVKKDFDYVWKMQKNFIKARGGAVGLFIELEHIGHNYKIKGYEVLDSVFDNLKKLYGGAKQ